MMKRGGILRATALVSALTAASRLLGLVREMLQSRLLGAGVEQSAFAAAFAIPNLARRAFGEGALTAAFVPIFKDELATDASRVRARALARAVLTLMLLFVSSLVVLIWVLTSATLQSALASSFSTKWLLTLQDVRLLIVYMVFICGAAFGMGVMNALGKFGLPALMPSILNGVWITALVALFFFPSLAVQTRVEVICLAILVAGLLQMAFLFVCMHRHGISPLPTWHIWRESATRLVWRNMAIGCVGAGAVQINYMLDQVLALKASDWAAGAISYADRLMELPLGIVGTAFGTVLLPTFSGFFSTQDRAGACHAFQDSLRNMLLIVLPAAVALVVLAPEITHLVYHGGRFDDLAVTRVGRLVACYSVGLAFFCTQKTLTPWFQAQKDLTTPLKISVRMVFLNAFLNVLAVFGLPEEFRPLGLATSTVLCSALSCLALARVAQRTDTLGWRHLMRPLAHMLFACVLLAGALILLRMSLHHTPLTSTWNELGAMILYVTVGASVYFLSLRLIAPPLLFDFLSQLKGRSPRKVSHATH